LGRDWPPSRAVLVLLMPRLMCAGLLLRRHRLCWFARVIALGAVVGMWVGRRRCRMTAVLP
jgi:hypothetical protein